MIMRLALYSILISFTFGQHIRVKCPYDATFIKNTEDYKIDEKTGDILWKYECGGLVTHPFFVKRDKLKEKSSSANLAKKFLRSLPKPGENATLKEIALYNRILILLTWLDLDDTSN
ncbi:MAG: hypothetical protein CMG74_03965 [Candidatus Marinimicrobia bacterium]|nr:hypothetical protein [Candidatus Neomarinimicrobiota bacterium]